MAHSPLYIRIMNSQRWQNLSRAYKAEHPLCMECEKHGTVSPSQCVHHITEIESARTDKEAWDLALSRANLQALCFKCHSEIHRARRSHTKEIHRQRNDERLQQWISRHTKNKQS